MVLPCYFSITEKRKFLDQEDRKMVVLTGISFGQKFCWSGPQALIGYKVILENYRANARL